METLSALAERLGSLDILSLEIVSVKRPLSQ